MRERDLFIAALHQQDPAERAAFLARSCGEDRELRERVEALLREQEQLGSFLERPAEGVGETGAFTPARSNEAAAPREEIGSVIGPYKLVQEIGEGGMGTVWMAQQTEPVKRLVAIKLIKPGMDSKQVLARFGAERQALALMDHPNIARVLDAGATAVGRPYFVMELVKGVPVTKYCDEHRLTPRQRLELFIPVCQAIQHAHQKGIIHRDIKPSNVLVAPYDGKPVVKVIDFGIAKATGQQLTEHTLVTGFGAVVGTLEYMSPEQAELNNQDIDTRSDIYSLGVLLYELLTGTTPLGKKRLKEAALLEVLRVIREEEPPRPSTRLVESTDTLPSISAQRQMEPTRLTRLVRGELDWIVMRALEKDRNRRYESANGLALDLQRFLADEPVLAAPPSAWYRFRKFASRNKVALTAGTAVAAALVLAVIVMVVSVVLISQEQAATEQARGEKEQEYRGRITALEGETNALGREKQALRREKNALESWRQISAMQGTTLAFEEYQGANIYRAAALLDECPADLRRWEWHYLKRLCSSELATHRVPGIPYGSAFSPSGNEVALVDAQGLHGYDLVAGRERLDLRDHNPSDLGDPAFSADGRRIAVGAVSERGQHLINVLEMATGKVIAAREIATPKVGDSSCRLSGVALSSDGELAAATDLHGNLFVWETLSGKQRFTAVAHPNARPLAQRHTHVAFNHDGSRLATACEADGSVRIWEVKSGTQVEALGPGEGFSRVVYSPKGTWLAAAGKFHRGEQVLEVWLWDASTGKRRYVLRGHTRPITCMAFTPDERLLATGSYDSRLLLWDVQTGKQVAVYCGHDAGIKAVSFRDQGKQLASVGRNGGLGRNSVLKTWDVTHPPEFIALESPNTYSVTFSPDNLLATVEMASNRCWVRMWDTAARTEVAKVGPIGVAFPVVAFSRDRQWLAVAGLGGSNNTLNGGVVSVWDRKLGKVALSLPAAGDKPIGECFAVAYSPNDGLLAAGGVDHLVYVWDAGTGATKFRLAGHRRAVANLTFSPDGRRLYSASGRWLFGGDDMTRPCEVKVWDLASGAELSSLELPDGLRVVALSTDGEVVAATGRDNTVRLYEMGTKKVRAILKGHSTDVARVTFSPDGLRVVTLGRDQSVRLWDARSGRLILNFGHQPDAPAGNDCVAFSPNGWQIAFAGLHRVLVRDSAPQKQ